MNSKNSSSSSPDSVTTLNRRLLIHAYGSDPVETLLAALRVTANAHREFDPDVRIRLVVQGPAVALLTAGSEQIKDLEAAVALRGVAVVACRNSLRSAGVAEDELHAGIRVVSSAVAYLAEKQWKGWAYVRI